MVLGSLWNFRFRDLSPRDLNSPPAGCYPCPRRIFLHKAQVPEWCTGIPVLVHWVAIAMFRMAAGALCVCAWVCGRPGNRKIPGLIPSWATLVFLFPWARNFTHITSVYPTVKVGTWWPGANWGSSPPSCNINGYLV